MREESEDAVRQMLKTFQHTEKKNAGDSRNRNFVQVLNVDQVSI